jgi:cytoskeletal protein RodZ
MTKNQKIAIGCGGAGCLGLIVVAIIAVAVYVYYQRNPAFNSNGNSNYNANSNSNANRNSNRNSNTPDSSSSSSSSSMSDDDKHKLYYAASVTGDSELMKRVNQKLGLMDANGRLAGSYTDFAKDHIIWIIRNTEWIKDYNDKQKARDYVEEHIND